MTVSPGQRYVSAFSTLFDRQLEVEHVDDERGVVHCRIIAPGKPSHNTAQEIALDVLGGSNWRLDREQLA